MTSLHHRLCRDELIVLVETIEHDAELRFYKANEKSLLISRLVSPSVKQFECYNCKRWAMTYNGMCCFDEDQSWKELQFDLMMHTHGNMMILKCGNCSKCVCKGCSYTFEMAKVVCLLCANKLNNPPKNRQLQLLQQHKFKLMKL